MNLIEQLAELVGFHNGYIDSYGQYVFAKNEAQAALLHAMGYQLDENSLKFSIKNLMNEKWHNVLPMVHIAKLEDEQHFITLNLPADQNRECHWQIITESNQKISGTISLDDLKLIEQSHHDNVKYSQFSLPLPLVEQGYHQLTVEYGKTKASTHLIVAPQTCYSVKETSATKVWGVAAQLYALKSKSNWGIGDFTDLVSLVEQSAEQGASVIGINPLHPLYPINPAHISPYSPTSRNFLNTLYIDVSSVANFSECTAAQQKVNSLHFIKTMAKVKQASFIQYVEVAQLKFEVLALLFDDFTEHKNSLYQHLACEFEQFKDQHGEDLFLLATFDALYEHFHALDNKSYGWPDWPEAFQHPNSTEVIEFQQQHARRIDYFSFLQWIAHQQLSKATLMAKNKKLPLGLYLDLAVGCDGSGVDVWSKKDIYVSGAAVGAPPDAMNTLGQNWGLTPINPVALQKEGYQTLVKALRTNMQYAGALRIDHILGLMRQYWVAPGMAADEGVYITFPFSDILRIIALESHRNNCVVIGEDLGNVPEGFSDVIQAAGLLSYKVLFFECWESGLFKRPENYPELSMATVSTHDIPTLTGWWLGRDLQWREQLKLYPNDEMMQHEQERRIQDRQYLLSALEDLHVIDKEKLPSQNPAQMNRELSTSVQKYLAQSPSYVQLIALEDMLENIEQVNIPGTIDEHPNWRQKLPVSMEDFWQTSSVVDITQTMRMARPKT